MAYIEFIAELGLLLKEHYGDRQWNVDVIHDNKCKKAPCTCTPDFKITEAK